MYLAMLLGSIVGSSYDPVFWMCVAIAVATPFFGRSWPIYLLILSLLAALLRIGIAGSNRAAMGMKVDDTIVWTGAAVFVAMVIVGLVVAVIRKTLRRPS